MEEGPEAHKVAGCIYVQKRGAGLGFGLYKQAPTP
jgi:hypothetical protein